MRRDLLDAYAAVEWTVAKLPDFGDRLGAWVSANFEVVVKELDPPATDDLIVLKQNAEIPPTFSVEAGAYINALRSALDVLATVLGRRYNVLYPEDWYFPVAQSAEGFARGEFAGGKLIKGLPADARHPLEALRPYQGGHPTIWPLHHLDIARKHRRLLTTFVRPAIVFFSGPASSRNAVTPLHHPAIRPTDDETPLAFMGKGATYDQLNVTADVAFDEPGMTGESVVATLYRFASDVGAIIATSATA